jgi:hypothetical protein
MGDDAPKSDFIKAYGDYATDGTLLNIEKGWNCRGGDVETYRGINSGDSGSFGRNAQPDFWALIDVEKLKFLDALLPLTPFQNDGKNRHSGYYQTVEGKAEYKNNMAVINSWIQKNKMADDLNFSLDGNSQIVSYAQNFAKTCWDTIQADDLSQDMANMLFELFFWGPIRYLEAIGTIYYSHNWPLSSGYGYSEEEVALYNTKINSITDNADMYQTKEAIALYQYKETLYTTIKKIIKTGSKFSADQLDLKGLFNRIHKMTGIHFDINMRMQKNEIEQFIIMLNQYKILVSLKSSIFKKYMPTLEGIDWSLYLDEKSKLNPSNKSKWWDISITWEKGQLDACKKLDEGLQKYREAGRSAVVSAVAGPAQTVVAKAWDSGANYVHGKLVGNKSADGDGKATVVYTEAGVLIEGASVFTGALGGLITRPTLSLIGEAGQSEAVIPLSNLRTDPSRSTPDMEIGKYSAHFPGVKALGGGAAPSKTSATVQYLHVQQHANRRTGQRNSQD